MVDKAVKADKPWYFIVNPNAGSGKTMGEWSPAEAMILSRGIPFYTSFSDRKGHAVSLAYEAASDGFRNIIVVGGDGSVHEVFCGIMKWCEQNGCEPSEFSLGVIPIGSGNDWIKGLGVPHNTRAVIKLLTARNFVPMDVVKVESSEGTCYMANVGGVGFDSRVCKRVNYLKDKGFSGRMLYFNALIFNVLKASPINIEVLADGKSIFRGPAYSVAIGNGSYSGSGMQQVPGARMDDGLIDVTVIPVLPLSFIARQIPKLFTGELNKVEELVHAQCKLLEIIPLDELSAESYEIDGELEGKLPVKISMTDRQINVLSGFSTSAEPSTERP